MATSMTDEQAQARIGELEQEEQRLRRDESESAGVEGGARVTGCGAARGDPLSRLIRL